MTSVFSLFQKCVFFVYTGVLELKLKVKGVFKGIKPLYINTLHHFHFFFTDYLSLCDFSPFLPKKEAPKSPSSKQSLNVPVKNYLPICLYSGSEPNFHPENPCSSDAPNRVSDEEADRTAPATTLKSHSAATTRQQPTSPPAALKAYPSLPRPGKRPKTRF